MPEKELYSKRRRADELFDLVKLGDQKAFELLFSIFFDRLNDFARKVLKDEMISQDLVLETFTRLWESRDKIESTNVEALLFCSVRNRCLDYLKHLKVEQNRMQGIAVESKYEELYRIDFVGNEPYMLIEKELEMKIEQTIQHLPDRCREVFLLSRIKGLKNREIAEELQISIKNVERHLNRALQSFRANFSSVVLMPFIGWILRCI